MDAIKAIENELSGKFIEFDALDKAKTALIVVDMVNGFVYSGVLSSPRVASIVENIVYINEKTKGCKKVFFIDSHDNSSEEFRSFPIHCLKDTEESSLIEPLKFKNLDEPETVYIEKNSTNGFLTYDFQIWLQNNIDDVDNFIVTGCVTDICILQFTLTLKAYINENNLKKRIIVPQNAVDTYEVGAHDGNLMNLFALYNMYINGIEIVDRII